MAQISNKPSFRLDRQPSTKAQLQYIGNLSRGDRPKRTIVVAASLTTAAETALQWVIDNLAKVGDAIHICHICKVREAQAVQSIFIHETYPAPQHQISQTGF